MKCKLTMYNDKIDIGMLSENWIKDQTTSDKLEQMGHKFLSVKIPDRPGGGIGLLVNSYLDITELDKEHYDSYECGIWKLKLDSKGDHSLWHIDHQEVRSTKWVS